MRHILSLRHYWLHANDAIAMCTMMLGRLFPLLFAEDISPSLLLTRNLNGLTSVIRRCRSWGCNPLDLGWCPFSVIFDLDCGQEVTPILISQGTIVLLVILKLIMHGWGESVLNSNSNLINRELFVADLPTSFIKNIALCWRWRWVICWVLHILVAFSLTDKSDTEWLHNIIANIFQVVQYYAAVVPPHTLYQLGPNLLLKVGALVQTQVGFPIIDHTVTLSPSPEVLCI